MKRLHTTNKINKINKINQTIKQKIQKQSTKTKQKYIVKKRMTFEE